MHEFIHKLGFRHDENSQDAIMYPLAKRPDHPGYYWLVYNWKNLLPACTHCNQYRIARPRWRESINTRGGKSTHFPVKFENKRVMNHLADLKLVPALIHLAQRPIHRR